jgi:hypothetical protein
MFADLSTLYFRLVEQRQQARRTEIMTRRRIREQRMARRMIIWVRVRFQILSS